MEIHLLAPNTLYQLQKEFCFEDYYLERQFATTIATAMTTNAWVYNY